MFVNVWCSIDPQTFVFLPLLIIESGGKDSPGLENQAGAQSDDVVGIDVCEDILEDNPEMSWSHGF